MIIEAKVNDANSINHLKEEICFLMRENDSKNNIIITLLEMFQHDKKKLIETSRFDVKKSEVLDDKNNTPERHLIIHDDDDFKSLISPTGIHGDVNRSGMSPMNHTINNYRNIDAYHDSNESCSASNTDLIESINDRDDIECNNEYPNEHHEQIKANNIEKQINEVR